MFKQLDTLGKALYLGSVVPLFLALFSPLLVDSAFLFPFITTKTLFFRICVELAIFFYILLALRYPVFRPKLTALMKIVLVFAGVVTIASLLGVDLYRSFWGNIERGEGLLTLYHLFALFLILPQVVRDKRQWQWVLHTLVFVSLLATGYALLQLFNASFVIQGGESRLSATIGNPAFFAGYIIFGIFISAYLFSVLRHQAWRVYYAIVILLELFILFKTQTRGSFLGLVGGLLLSLLLISILSRQRRTKKYAASAIIVIILLGAGVWAFRDSAFVQNVGILRRLSTISTTNITTESRLLTWDSSWQGFKDRPLFGYGWENYNVAFNKYFHAEIFRDAGSQIWFDRAHNVVFDILVTSGLVGFIAYVSIFVIAFRTLYRRWRQTNELPAFAILPGLLAAYLLQNLFVFDVLATYISLFVLLAFIARLEPREETAAPIKTARWTVLGVAAPVLLLLLVLSIVSFNTKLASANKQAVDALILSAQGQQDLAAETFTEAIALDTNQTVEIRQKFAELALTASRNAPTAPLTGTLFSQAIAETKNSIREHPLNAQSYLMLMILYNNSEQFDRSRLDQALAAGERALELSPTRPQIYFELGQSYLAQGDLASGVAAFAEAVELQPNALESRWNLALAYAVANDQAGIKREFEWLEAQGFEVNSILNLRRLAGVYVETQNYERLAEVYEQLVAVDAADAANWIRLATTYQILGRHTEARQAALQAVELDQSLADDVEVFIQNLPQ